MLKWASCLLLAFQLFSFSALVALCASTQPNIDPRANEVNPAQSPKGAAMAASLSHPMVIPLIGGLPPATNIFSLTVTAQMATNGVTLAWNPSTDPTVVGYDVYYGPASGNYTNTLNAGNATNLAVTGLSCGAIYYFAATTYNSSGVQSPFSNEVTNREAQLTNSYAFLSFTNAPPTQQNLFRGKLSTNSLQVLSSPDLKQWSPFTNYAGRFKTNPPALLVTSQKL